MKKTMALTAAALLAFTATAFAGAHNQAAENENRSANGQAAVDKVPNGLANPKAVNGLTAATTKSGNSNKDD